MPITSNFATAISDLVTDLTSAEIANIDNAIFEDTFMIGKFGDYHTLMTGRRNGNLQPIINSGDNFGSMPLQSQTSCDLNPCDLNTEYSSKSWCLSEYACRLEICMRSFDENFLVFWNTYRQGLEDPTTVPSNDAFLEYITNEVKRNIQGTQWRVGYWGDDASANPLVSGCDGYFVQAEAGNGTKISPTFANPENPTGQEIYDVMLEAYNAAIAQPWGGAADLVWDMSYFAASRLVGFLNTTNDLSAYNCGCIDPSKVVNARTFSIENFSIFGIPVQAHREIDLSANALGMTAGADLFKILLTRKSNLLYGVSTEDRLGQFDIFFDRVSRKIYIDSMVEMGVLLATDDYVYISL